MSCLLEKNVLDKLVADFGSPLYVFHELEFAANYNHLLEAFRTIYPKYNIGYSYKTNYTPYICNLVKKMGGYAEVVSEMEYNLAKRIGYKNEHIIYNGPVKGAAIFEHLLSGGTVNVDSLDELNTIIEFANKNPKQIIELALRANIDISQGYVSRFGLDAYEEEKDCELSRAIKMISFVPNLRIVGLHCHVGKSRNLKAWENRIRIMFVLIDRFLKDNLKFIDFGSGMNSIMEPELAKQFNDDIPSFEQYAALLAGAMNKKFGNLPFGKQPWLITEPGTTLVSGTMSFIGTVKSIKNVKNKQFVTFDCSGGNLGDICRLKQLPLTIFHNFQQQNVECKNATFVGYTCLEHDIIYDNYNGSIAVGDYVQFRNVGSYSNVFKPPFILPNCAMITINSQTSQIKLIKRKETFDDVFETYIF